MLAVEAIPEKEVSTELQMLEGGETVPEKACCGPHICSPGRSLLLGLC
jgi:hypothetical protein